MGFLGGLGSLFGGGKGKGAPLLRGQPGAAYMRGEQTALFSTWAPSLRDPKYDVQSAWWQGAARTIDLLHNSGWLAGVVNKGCASVMGTGLQLALNPDAGALGWDAKTANDWARIVERRWELWARTPLECDAAGKNDIHQLAKAALRSYFGLGEWVVWFKWINRPESKTRTKICLIPAHRLVQNSNGSDLFQGVRVDQNGLPRSYLFQLETGPFNADQYTEIRARDAGNRATIRHCFDGDIGQMRGMSVFAPVLQVLRQYDQLANATLTSALAQAIVAATIESPSPTQDVLSAFATLDEQGVGGDMGSYLEARAGWYDKTNFNLGGLARIVHLFSGEKLDFKRSETPNSNYEPFSRFLLREMAACGGFTFEDVTGDYTGATYSSIKMSTTTNWPVQLWRRAHIAAPFYQSAFECWLEESIERGETPLPGDARDAMALFTENRAALCRATWRGPSKPIPDEVKFALANEKLYGLGVVTSEMIAGELGHDIEDVYDQLAREKAMREERGLPDPVIVAPPSPAGAEDAPDKPEGKD
jgi:lambda family phage portal protein